MARKQLVVHVVGARPNYMKIAPVYAALDGVRKIEQRLVHTGQHYDREVNDVFFAELPLPKPDVQLTVGSGTHAEQTARALVELERVFVEWRPDLHRRPRRRELDPRRRRWRRRSSTCPSAISRPACGATTRRCPRSTTGA